MNDDHTDKATDKNVGDPTKSSGELEEVSKKLHRAKKPQSGVLADYYSIDQVLTSYGRWVAQGYSKTEHLSFDRAKAAIEALHTTQTTKLQAEARIKELKYLEGRTVVGKDSPKDDALFVEVVPLVTIVKRRVQIEREHKVKIDEATLPISEEGQKTQEHQACMAVEVDSRWQA